MLLFPGYNTIKEEPSNYCGVMLVIISCLAIMLQRVTLTRGTYISTLNHLFFDAVDHIYCWMVLMRYRLFFWPGKFLKITLSSCAICSWQLWPDLRWVANELHWLDLINIYIFIGSWVVNQGQETKQLPRCAKNKNSPLRTYSQNCFPKVWEEPWENNRIFI